MIELSRHIESLLLKHNCVIIPNLGGFVAQDCSAAYIEEENLFLPPYRDVAFNPLLQVNDGLLAQSYMNATGASYVETQRTIETAVANLKRRIEESQSVELSGIGTLKLAGNGQYEFAPVMGGVVAPAYFGLDSVIAKPIVETTTAETETLEEKEAVSKKYYTLRLHKGAIKSVAAAAIATIFYFLWPVAFNVNSEDQIAEAQVAEPAKTNVIKKEISKVPQSATFVPVAETIIPTELRDIVEEVVTDADLNVAPVSVAEPAEANTEKTVAEPATAAPTPEKTEQPASKVETEQGFVLVLASQVSPAGAEELVGKMQKAGFKESSVRHDGKIRRVTFGTYPSQEAAGAALRSLRQQHPAFTEAWVLKL